MSNTFYPALHRLESAAQYTMQSSHSNRFQPLLFQLMTLFCAEHIIPDMSEDAIRWVVYLSRFHDIGKQSLPKAILQKPGALTLEERRIMQMHPDLGVAFLRSIPELRFYPYYDILYDICRHHHERWDGGGYPDGLNGSHITPYVHVVSLVDAYDALRTERPYKRALSHGEASDMLCRGDCGAFDPAMMDCFRKHSDAICISCYGEERKVG